MESLCGPDGKCVYHDINETVIEDLKNAVKVLLEGQQDLKITVIQLTEAFKSVDRIEAKIDKMDVAFSHRLEKVEDDYNLKIDDAKERITKLETTQNDLKEFMWKCIGAGVVLVPVLGLIGKIFLGV